MANLFTADLPIIDYSKIVGHLNPGSAESLTQSQAEKARLFRAFADVGFVCLSNHPIPARAEKELFAHARRFFALPEGDKAKLETGESKGFHGWFSPARTSGGSAISDQKEAFDVGNDEDCTRPNQWPEDWPELREDMNQFFDACHEIHLVLLKALAEQVGAPEGFFEPRVRDRDHFFRIIYYPETVRESFKTRFRATPHTDYGTLTLLFNDDKGGLQVKNADGVWIDVLPIPGCIIVNVGDLLARWFNDQLKSTEHRVIDPKPEVDGDGDGNSSNLVPARYSIAWFGHPNREEVVDPLDMCCTTDRPKKYEPVVAGRHVVERLAYLHEKGRNAAAWSDDLQRIKA